MSIVSHTLTGTGNNMLLLHSTKTITNMQTLTKVDFIMLITDM